MCTGHAYEFDWVKLPVLISGIPIQQRGVTSCKHVYFLGLHWMHTFKSGVFFGAGDDAAYLADHMRVVGLGSKPLLVGARLQIPD
jgi:putative flavoprotein involved in K+ transport